MTTDWKALCAELVNSWTEGRDIVGPMHHARTALSQPEPEDKILARVEFAKRDFDGPSDAILAQYCDNWFYGDPNRTEVDPVDLCRGAIKLFAQIPAPTPASERLPGPEDCSHPENECWWFDPASDGAWYIDTYQGNYTYWLPYYALPIPPVTEKP